MKSVTLSFGYSVVVNKTSVYVGWRKTDRNIEILNKTELMKNSKEDRIFACLRNKNNVFSDKF